MVGQLVGRLGGALVDRLIGLVGWLVCWLSDWLDGRSVARPSWSLTQTSPTRERPRHGCLVRWSVVIMRVGMDKKNAEQLEPLSFKTVYK